MTAALEGIPGRLNPERAAALGVPPGVEIIEGAMCWWGSCPSCTYGAVPLLPDSHGRLVPSTIGCCIGRAGWRCSSERIAEAWEALRQGRELEPTAEEAERVGRILAHRLRGLWIGSRGSDPWRALWAARFTLEEVGLPARLVRLGLEALAHRRGWPVRLVQRVAA